jgi:transposase
VDEWAFRRGDAYGTVLVDLERHCSIDILPDRKTETLAAWLKRYPIISRDRTGPMPKALRKAPLRLYRLPTTGIF